MWDKLPLVPVSVKVYVPAAAVPVFRVSVEDPEPPGIDAGLKLAVAPVGTPLTLRATVPVKALRGETEAV